MTIYQPAEDSYLMQDILKQELPKLLEEDSDLRFLEIGPGSGIHLETVRKLGVKKDNIFSVDIDSDVIAHCQVLGFNCKKSDLFEEVEGKYEVIIFNPPYLPEDSDEPDDSRTTTTGGTKGCEIINRFLRNAKDYLKEGGRVYLITSSLSGCIEWGKWSNILRGSEKLFFEELFIWELRR